MTFLKSAKIRLFKWAPYILLGLLIFLSDAPATSSQQKIPVQTEQRDEARTGKTLFHFGGFHRTLLQTGFPYEGALLWLLLNYSHAIRVSFKHRSEVASFFTPFGINLVANFLPRSVIL